MEYTCSICGLSFDTIDDLIAHLQSHKDSDEVERKERLENIHTLIDELTDEIDSFNEDYEDYMEIDYDFTFTKKVDEEGKKVGEKSSKEKGCPCNTLKNVKKEENEETKTFNSLLKSFIENNKGEDLRSVIEDAEKDKEDGDEEALDFLTNLISFFIDNGIDD